MLIVKCNFSYETKHYLQGLNVKSIIIHFRTVKLHYTWYNKRVLYTAINF